MSIIGRDMRPGIDWENLLKGIGKVTVTPLPKAIGVWLHWVGEHEEVMGTVYFGSHAHRTAPQLAFLSRYDNYRRLVEYCEASPRVKAHHALYEFP